MFFKKRIDKKAEMSSWVMTFIIDLAIVAIITIILLVYVHDVATDTRFEKGFLARDIALLVNAVYASPYDLVLEYSSDRDDFVYDFNNYRVDVYNKVDIKKTEQEREESIGGTIKRETGELLNTLSDIRIDFSKGSYHIASDKAINPDDIKSSKKIEEDSFIFKKESGTLRIK